MKDFVREATQDLLTLHKESKICRTQSDLCVEGFPRSANTFCVDFLSYLCNINNHQLIVAHHTHSPLNVQLAIHLRKPCLVLIREPEQAITSHTIYSGARIPVVTERYMNFYAEVENWKNSVLIADFKTIIDDINHVITKLNQRYQLEIPLSKDVAKDSKHVGMVARKRALARHSENKDRLIRTVGSPTREREQLKDVIRPKVEDHIASRPDVMERYNTIRQFSNYIS